MTLTKGFVSVCRRQKTHTKRIPIHTQHLYNTNLRRSLEFEPIDQELTVNSESSPKNDNQMAKRVSDKFFLFCKGKLTLKIISVGQCRLRVPRFILTLVLRSIGVTGKLAILLFARWIHF
jgi:hypothetical protein